MSWHGVLGQDAVFERFERAVARGRLASTFLFVGPSGVGKKLAATRLAAALLCERSPAGQLMACGSCSSCQLVRAGTHPDLHYVAREVERSKLAIHQFIGEGEDRLRVGLCHDLSLKPSLGRRRIGIIDDADLLTVEAANCLLKTLEEPPPGAVVFLLGTSVQKQLPTIRSRCQIVNFAPLDTASLTTILRQLHPELATSDIAQLAELADGSLERANELADGELRAFREPFLRTLAQVDLRAVALAKETLHFINEAGKEAPKRRHRTRQVFGMASEFYRQLMNRLAGVATTGDQLLGTAVEAAAKRWKLGLEPLVDCVEHCAEGISHVDANANQDTLVESWCDELAELCAGRAARNAAAWS